MQGADSQNVVFRSFAEIALKTAYSRHIAQDRPCYCLMVAKIHEFIREMMSVDHNKVLSDEQRKEYETIACYDP